MQSLDQWSVFGVELVNNRADGPCRKQVLTWSSGNPPNNGGMSELTTMGPMGEAIVPQLAVREDAEFVRSITLVDGLIIARFSVLITVLVPEKKAIVVHSALSEAGCPFPPQPT